MVTPTPAVGDNPQLPENVINTAIMGAGMRPVASNVIVDNFAFPYLQADNAGQISIREPLPTDVLRPWENHPEIEPKITLLYFWLPECESCKEGMHFLSNLPLSAKMPANVQVVQMVSGYDATAVIADEMRNNKIQGRVFLDPVGGFAERLGVMAYPATFLVDENGRVVAYANGYVDFDTPWMDVLLARLGERKNPHQNTTNKQVTLWQEMQIPREIVKLPLSVKFLDASILGVTSIGIAIALWYYFVCYLKNRRRRRAKPKISA